MNCAASRLYEGHFEEAAVTQVAKDLHEELGRRTSSCAFVFATEDYLPHLADFTELLRVHGHIVEIGGCISLGTTGIGIEKEEGSGFSILVLGFDDSRTHFVDLTQAQLEENAESANWSMEPGLEEVHGWIALLNPLTFNAEKWMAQWNKTFPGVPCIGGLASSNSNGENIAVFHNEKAVDGLAVGFSGSVRMIPALSQGCRPIGEPLPVTRVEANVIFSLGARPAYEALESAFNSLENSEKAEAKGNLLAGLAATEYVEEFKPGDFVVRNILGADPKSGAVAIGGFPRMGQTVQYQFRSREAAGFELRNVLEKTNLEHKPLASLLFSCNGRGTHFFGKANHDAGMLLEVLGNHASAGCFCNGEIGAAGEGKNGIHGYTVSAALFV